jgi:Ca2+-binding RTX toxin-like protein
MRQATSSRRRARWRSLALLGAFSVLLAQFVVWAGAASAQVPTPVLYGANGADFTEESSELYTIDPATGARVTTIGEIGFEVTGLAVDPTNGQLYGSTASGDPDFPGALIKINKATGQGSLVGLILLNCDEPALPDITSTTTGQLFGWNKDCAPTDRLVQINKTTGRGTVLGPSGVPDDNGNGLAADPDDNTLWLTPDNGNGIYGTVDATTGVFTSQGTLDGTGPYADPISALAWSCDGETLFASVRDGFLATINTATDDLTEVGRGDPLQDAIVWDCNPQQNPQQPVAMCQGQAATLVGTTGSDVLTGTNGKDVIAGLGGNDRIAGLGGNDRICAGGGNDKANGGGGNDRIRGQAGNDRLKGAGGRDNLRGGGGTDRCNGGPGTDKGNCESETSIP